MTPMGNFASDIKTSFLYMIEVFFNFLMISILIIP